MTSTIIYIALMVIMGKSMLLLEKKLSGKYKKTAVSAISITLFLIVLLSPIYYEYPNYGLSEVITLEHGRVVKHTYGTVCFEWGKKFSNLPMIEAPTSGTVQPVTENPKVMRVTINLKTLITNPDSFYQNKNRMFNLSSFGFKNNHKSGISNNISYYDISSDVTEEIQKIVAGHLNQFMYQHSKTLAKFFDPTDKSQNEELSKLVIPYLNEKCVSDGITTYFKNFSIE